MNDKAKPLKLWLFKLVLSSAAHLLIEISSWTFKLKLLPFDIPLWFYDEINTIDHDQQLQQFCIHRVPWYPKYRVSSTHISSAVRYVHRSCYSCVTWVKEVFFAETCASKVARSATKTHFLCKWFHYFANHCFRVRLLLKEDGYILIAKNSVKGSRGNGFKIVLECR